MNIITHTINQIKIAEINVEEMLISTTEEGLQLLVDLYYQEFDRIIIYEHHLASAFFDLKNGMAGEILQKFSNYRVRLAVIGDFSKYTKESILQFMSESNKMKHINFVSSLEDALKILSVN